jgi:hypothetical protein
LRPVGDPSQSGHVFVVFEDDIVTVLEIGFGLQVSVIVDVPDEDDDGFIVADSLLVHDLLSIPRTSHDI